MTTLDQFVGNIRQLSLEGKYKELSQLLTNPNSDHLNKNIQHIDSIIATFTLPENSMVEREDRFVFFFHVDFLVYASRFTCNYKSTKSTGFRFIS